MPEFVQIIEYTTTRGDEIEAVMEEWLAATEGQRTATWGLTCVDRDNPNRRVQIVRFPSHEKAMENSDMPQTAEFAKRIAELCDGPPTFRNLDVVREAFA